MSRDEHTCRGASLELSDPSLGISGTGRLCGRLHAQVERAPPGTYTCATALLLSRSRWPTPGLRPPIMSGCCGLRSHTTPRLRSQMRAVQPHRQSSLLLLIPFLPSPRSPSLSVLSFLCHPPRLTPIPFHCPRASVCVKGGAAGREEGRATVGWALIKALSTNPSLGRDHCSHSSD